MDWTPVKLRGERTHEDGIDRIRPAKEMAAIGSRNPSGQDALTLKCQSAKVDHTPSRVRLLYPLPKNYEFLSVCPYLKNWQAFSSPRKPINSRMLV